MKYAFITMSIGLLCSLSLTAMNDNQNDRQVLSQETMHRKVQQLSTATDQLRQRLDIYQASFTDEIPDQIQLSIQHSYELIELIEQNIEAFSFADGIDEMREYYHVLNGLYHQLRQPANNRPVPANHHPAPANRQPAARNAAPAPQPQAANQAQQINCNICLETKNARECVTLSCHHTYCRPCLAELLNQANRDRDVLVRCPQCQAPINDNDRRAITNDHALLDRFGDRENEEWIRTHAKHCPNPRCGVVFEVEPNQRFRVNCRNCGSAYCSSCLRNHPMDRSCQEAARQLHAANAEERASDELIRQTTKQCPNCHNGIEKNGGCIHMTCSQCHHEFCWQCMRPWAQHSIPGQAPDYTNCVLRHNQPQQQANQQPAPQQRPQPHQHRHQNPHNIPQQQPYPYAPQGDPVWPQQVDYEMPVPQVDPFGIQGYYWDGQNYIMIPNY